MVDGKIYVISDGSGLTYIYDPETDSWSYGASIPMPVWDAAAGMTTGLFTPKRVYVIGGRTGSTGTSLNQVYDPESDQWIRGAATMPTSRFALAVAVVKDTLYALGGWSSGPLGGTAYAVNELYIPFGYEGSLPPYWYPPPSPSPSPTTNPTTSPSSTPTPSPLPSPSEQPTKTPEPQPKHFPTTLLIASVVLVAIVCVGLLVYFKKRKH